MRIHSDTLTSGDLYDAARRARVSLEHTTHGSRSRARAFEVHLSGSSPYHTNSGTYGAGEEYAARWDEWGVFLARLFDADPAMYCVAYDGRADFYAKTAEDAKRGRRYTVEGRGGRDYTAPWLPVPRKRSKFVLCERHAPWFAGETRRRQLECMVEGGPGGWTPGCEGGKCRLWPGTDVFEPSVCHGELALDWTETPGAEASARLEELRAAIRAETISYGEIAELQGLAEYIEPGDVELLEWAGAPEFTEEASTGGGVR